MLQGFKLATTDTPQRMILSLNSLEKCGKTHFIFTSPGAIAYMNFDKPADDILWQFPDKRIFVKDYRTKDTDQSAYRALKMEFYNDFVELLKSPDIRTIALDTGTQLWNIYRMAEFGKLTQVQPWFYTPLNEEFRALIALAYDSDKNVIFSHKNKKRYVQAVKGSEKEVWDGSFEKAGFNEIGFLVQANIQLTREDEPPFDFVCYITDCAQNGALKGMELRNDQITFGTLAQMVFPDSDETDWL